MLRIADALSRPAWCVAGDPVRAVVALFALAVGVGLFLPLLGISLAAFVVIDLLIGFHRWRKAGAPPQEDAAVEPAEESDELLV